MAQDEGEKLIRKALEGRQILVKMDLPAVETGIPMVFDDTNITFDEANYKKLLKEYGVGTAKGTRARITAVRVSNRGIEIDLDGGGSPQRDWLVGNVTLVGPTPLGKSDHEQDLERQLQNETRAPAIELLRNELELERQSRIAQDVRNQEAFQRVASLRSKYIEENRKNWGSKLIIVIRSRKPNVLMRDMVKSLAQYAELLPRETTTTTK
jgi:hypothetical protein